MSKEPSALGSLGRMLLVATLVARAVIVLAYLRLPDFERALRALVSDGAALLGVG